MNQALPENSRVIDSTAAARLPKLLLWSMPRAAVCAVLLAICASIAPAAQMQGVLADWACIKQMVKEGRKKTLKESPSCSMANDYSRAAYGLITEDKKFYKLDDAGRDWALKLLKDTHDKDNLRVTVTGDIDGDTIHVSNMSEL